MTPEQIRIAIAKLDGFVFVETATKGFWSCNRGNFCLSGYTLEVIAALLPDYLNSRDAIVPVIEKVKPNWSQFLKYLEHQGVDSDYVLFATPPQLSIALLKATGNYEE